MPKPGVNISIKHKMSPAKSRQEQADYVGQYGVAITTLRPAGTVELEDGTRIDVVQTSSPYLLSYVLQNIKKVIQHLLLQIHLFPV